MKMLTTPRMDRCIGCHSCSLSCARLVYKKLSWNTAGIRIISSGGITTGFRARNCLACDPAPCVMACPTGAFSQRPGGGVKRDISLCDRCGDCARACPVQAVYLDHDQTPYVCIHCGRCVPFCPHQCLELGDVPERPGSSDRLRNRIENDPDLHCAGPGDQSATNVKRDKRDKSAREDGHDIR